MTSHSLRTLNHMSNVAHTRTRRYFARKSLLLVAVVLLVASSFGLAVAQPRPVRTMNTTGAATIPIERLGSISGVAWRLVSQPGLALFAGSKAVSVVNTVDLEHPRFISTLEFPDLVQGLAMQGRYAYVALGQCDGFLGDSCRGSLHIVDLANPTLPVVVGTFIPPYPVDEPMMLEGYVLLRDTAWRAGGPPSVIHIIDVRDPATPREVATIPDTADVTSVLLATDSATQHISAYLISRSGYLRVYDLADPTAPVLVTSNTLVTTDDLVLSAALYPDAGTNRVYAYVSDRSKSRPGIHVVDVSTPQQPSEVGFIATAPDTYVSGVVGNHLVVTTAYGSSQVFDLTQPATPVAGGSISTVLISNVVALDATHALVTSKRGIHVLNLINPAAPTLTLLLPTLYNIPGGPVAEAVFARNHLYIPSSDQTAMLDISRPTASQFRGTLPGNRVTLAGTLAATAGNGQVTLTDVAGPAPRELSTLALPTEARQTVALATNGTLGQAGSLLYLAWGNGLTVLDAADPTALKVVGALPINQSVRAVLVRGSLIYVATTNFQTHHLLVIDVAQPNAPVVRASLDLPSWARNMSVAGDRMYIATAERGLQILDVAQPQRPQIIGSYLFTSPYTTQSVATDGGLVYLLELLSSGTSTLHIVDLANPAAPHTLNRYDTALTNVQVSAQNGMVALFSIDGVVLLQRAASAGVVVDTLGLPIAGATLTASDQTTASGFRGTYRVPASLALRADSGGGITAGLAGFTSWPTQRSAAEAAAGTANFVMLAPPSTVVVTPSTGATAIFTDTSGATTAITVSSDAVATPTTLTLTPQVSPDLTDWAFAGHAFELGTADDAAKTLPATVTLTYRNSEIRLVADKAQLRLRRWDGTLWQDAGDGCAINGVAQHNLAAKTLTVPICRTGRYALFGPTTRLFLPALGS